MKILAVDPDGDGGIAYLDTDKKEICLWCAPPRIKVKMDGKVKPVRMMDFSKIPIFIDNLPKADVFVVESAGSRTGNSSQSTFTHGLTFGWFNTLAYSVCEDVVYCDPKKWKTALGVDGKGDRALGKDKCRSEINYRFPKSVDKAMYLRKHVSVAEALLMTVYHASRHIRVPVKFEGYTLLTDTSDLKRYNLNEANAKPKRRAAKSKKVL